MSGLPDRFWSKVEKTEGCWNWTAYKNPYGYGQSWLDGRLHLAHRLAYVDGVGPIPDGLQIDHLCRNRGCVRPDHLELVTSGENTRRGLAGDLTTHCPRGHALPKRPAGGGRRRCMDCYRNRDTSFKGSRVPDNASHGVSKTYTYYGCRCDLCREARMEYQRAYRRRRSAAAAGYAVSA